ncbi:secretogranin-1 isoform X1 [Malaclemys terrapin pileata]|uniref:secretogranin-1 isoform X1 n=1 Tax=Malaclemys terrapin pileata TaxID=2991368 RepID=UPI0023A7B43B|nr:secretogranin-1 isoform X1 [Malaclemys terrapin pileata]
MPSRKMAHALPVQELQLPVFSAPTVGAMEGDETALSHPSEDSSILDLPSAYDITDSFLLEHSTGTSDEPCSSVDTFASSACLGISSMPMEKDHVEEMVTRCIVEVLSTALSKPNAPPINPLCKDILKKSGRHKAEKKNENEEEQLEVRHLKESSEDEKHQHTSVEEERGQKEEIEEKHHHEEDESRGEEEKHNGDSHSHENRIHKGEKKHHLDIRGEEEEDDDENSYKRNNHSEEGSKEKKHHAEESGEAEHELPDKKSHSLAKSMEEFSPGDDKHSTGHRHSEEKMHSNEKRSHESEEEEEEEESSERNHHESKEHGSYQYRGHEESEESEEAEEEKRRYKPRHNHRKHRVGDSFKERRDHEGEKRNPLEESDEEENQFWDKKSHYQKHHYEEPEHHREEKRNDYGKHSSEDVEEKRHAGHGSEEYREQRHQNKENSEEEDKRHHLSGESEEERHEKKRHHDEPHEAVRHHYEGRKHHSEESEEELDKHHGHSSRDEKRHHGEGRHHLHDREDEEMHKLHSGESKGQSTGHYSTEERDSEEKRHYPGYDEMDAEIEKRRDSEDQKQDNEDSTEKVRYGEKEYKSYFSAENEKRAAIRYSPFYHRLQWKSRHLDKKDNMGDQILGSEQESRPSLNEKNFFPEYDYDWWEKKQLLDGLNHGHGEKRNLGRLHKLDMKRQYDRMDQLAQLLNYRKKSAEFPELYNSGEDLKKHQLIRSDKGNLSQRPLTEEEEKELENLAAMDLELQKIAEKFNDNRRG